MFMIYIFKMYLIPIILPAVTVIIGCIGNVPWFYIWLGILVSLVLVFLWLVLFDEWLYRVRVKDKVVFKKIRFAKDIREQGIHIGFEISSLALFPIEFEVTSLQVKLDDRVPKEEHKAKKYTIPPKGYGWFDSGIIKTDKIPSKVVDGYIEFTINYGKKGRSLNHILSLKKQIAVRLSDNNILEQGVWNDAV